MDDKRPSSPLRRGDDHPSHAQHIECLTNHGGRGVPRHCQCGFRWPCPMAKGSHPSSGSAQPQERLNMSSEHVNSSDTTRPYRPDLYGPMTDVNERGYGWHDPKPAPADGHAFDGTSDLLACRICQCSKRLHEPLAEPTKREKGSSDD